MLKKPTPLQQGTHGAIAARNLVLLAAIDDLLGIQEKATDTIQKARSGEKLSETDRDVLRHYEEGLQKTLDLIAPAGMEIRSNGVTINDRHARTLYVYNWPNYLYPNWLAATINYDAEFDIAQYIYPSSNKIIMKMLRKKVTEMRASVRMLEQKGIVRDPVLEAALQDAEELRDLLARGREKLFQFGMYITLYEEDEKRLRKLQTDIESILGGKLVLTKPAVFQMEHAWISSLPFCQDELEINRNINTSPLATSFPFSSAELTDDHGILYGINRHNDSLIIFDRFDLPNANATVFATSGAGKSFAVKLEILRSLMFGTDVFVIDPENEYVELCDAIGGSHIPVSLQSSHRINPFDLPKAVRGEEAVTGEILRAAAINLHGLFKLMLGTLTPAEDGVLDKAILDTYALRKITMDTKDPLQHEPPTMHDLVDVLTTSEGGEHMAQTLKKYTEGSYSGIFDQQTNIELDNQMVVFQIRDLEEQLRPIAMYVVLNFLWNRIRADFKRRFMIIDEAWNLMQHEDSARFLYGLIKRARKYYLGITTITQDIEDFVNSPYGKPIITNAALQILLKQSPSAVDNLQKLFYLTDGEKYLLLNSDIGQGLFFAGNKHVAIQIVASPQEEKLITTKPEDVLERREEKKRAKEQERLEKATAEIEKKEEKEMNELSDSAPDEAAPDKEGAKDTEAEEEQGITTETVLPAKNKGTAADAAGTPDDTEPLPEETETTEGAEETPEEEPKEEAEPVMGSAHSEKDQDVLQKVKPEKPSNRRLMKAIHAMKEGNTLKRMVDLKMQEAKDADEEKAEKQKEVTKEGSASVPQSETTAGEKEETTNPYMKMKQQKKKEEEESQEE